MGPVTGICQAGIQAAMVLSKRFSITTTISRLFPAIKDLVSRYGAAHHCRKVRCIDPSVLAMEADSQLARSPLVRETARARHDGGAGAVLPGCSGMSEMTESLSRTAGVVVIGGVVVAGKPAKALVGSRLPTPKANTYAHQRVKS